MHVIDVRGHEVRRNDMLELIEPKQRDLGEDLALVWYTLVCERAAVVMQASYRIQREK